MIEFQSRHLNFNTLCAISFEHTGEDPRRNDIVEICVMVLDNFYRPSRKVYPFYNQIAPFRTECIDYKTASINKQKISNCATYGLDPTVSADRFEEWVQKLDMPRRKGIIPLCYNWPLMREYLVSWLGFHNFNSLFPTVEYRDLLSTVLFINDSRNQVSKLAAYPRPEHLPYIVHMHGLSVRMSDDVMVKCIKIAEAYSRMLGMKDNISRKIMKDLKHDVDIWATSEERLLELINNQKERELTKEEHLELEMLQMLHTTVESKQFPSLNPVPG